MERELVNRDIPFSKDGDCLTFAATTDVLRSAELSAFGEAPPSGLSIAGPPKVRPRSFNASLNTASQPG